GAGAPAGRPTGHGGSGPQGPKSLAAGSRVGRRGPGLPASRSPRRGGASTPSCRGPERGPSCPWIRAGGPPHLPKALRGGDRPAPPDLARLDRVGGAAAGLGAAAPVVVRKLETRPPDCFLAGGGTGRARLAASN